MTHTLKIIFGKEQVLKAYNKESFTKEEEKLNIKEYKFESIEEKDAFIKGLNEAIGWTEFCIPELELCEG